MANQRDPNQVLVGFWADKEFAQKIDLARGLVPRSVFLRDALKQLLRDRGIDVSDLEAAAPDRRGKGGPIKFPEYKAESMSVNEGPSDAAIREQVISGTAQQGLGAAVKALGLKSKAASTTGKNASPKARAPRRKGAPLVLPKPAPTGP